MNYTIFTSDVVCHYFIEDVFKMREDKKKDFYYLLNDKKEVDEQTEASSTMSRKNSSFIFGQSKKPEKNKKPLLCFENIMENHQPLIKEETTSNEAKPIIENENNEKDVSQIVETEEKTQDVCENHEVSPIESENRIEKTIKEPIQIKEETIKIKEEPILIKEEPIRMKEDLIQIKEEPIQIKEETKAEINITTDDFKIEIQEDPFVQFDNKKKEEKKSKKFKNSILSHWETYKPKSKKNDEIKNLTIKKDEKNSSSVFFL